MFSSWETKEIDAQGVESQSSDRDKNTPGTSFRQGKGIFADISENVNNFFDRNLGSELTVTLNGKSMRIRIV